MKPVYILALYCFQPNDNKLFIEPHLYLSGYIWIFFLESDQIHWRTRGGRAGRMPPPMGPNSFVFAYIFTKKHPHQRSTTPLTGARPHLWEILDLPLKYLGFTALHPFLHQYNSQKYTSLQNYTPGMFWCTIVCQIIPPLQMTGVWKCNF